MSELDFKKDPFDLNRFISIQEWIYPTALSELKQGRKRSHWMWFIFPQLIGLGSSSDSLLYAIRTLEEAEAYLGHPQLGHRLVECCTALLEIQNRSVTDIFQYPDDLKLRSSMTLFSIAAHDKNSVFDQVLKKYFANIPDKKTIAILKLKSQG